VSGFDDIQFLREMVGEASVVSLGEATHGTREFFQMKHRILEFLVEEMDFSLFAIEASWPEANRLNDYVLTGEGDPETLLSGLYFWTWNTHEVLEMIEWMRLHNQNPGDDPTVQFLGFDMQFPGMAIHNVLEFLGDVDPPAVEEVNDQYGCMLPYSNVPTGFLSGRERYGEQPQAYRDDCLTNLMAVQEFLKSHQEEYEAASTPQEYAKAHRSARLVIQYEDGESGRTPGARDVYMAENAIWLHDQAEPGSKLVLWAHNGHVAYNPSFGNGESMGWHLRRHYGSEMVIVGFDFYQGGFRAVTRLSDGSYSTLANHSVGSPPSKSYEYYFHRAEMDRMILDVRGVDFSTPATSWLAGPRLMRSIGAVFTPSSPGLYLTEVSIPASYDLIIYFSNTSPAVGLPYDPPHSW
jgi:erythromycin esterase